MAKKKTTTDTELEIAPAAQIEAPEKEYAETDTSPADSDELEGEISEEQSDEDGSSDDKDELETLPPAICKILKTFASYPELWISSFGGVYTSKPATVKGAILYKNPYYNL